MYTSCTHRGCRLDGDWVGSWASSKIGEATTIRNCSNLGISESLLYPGALCSFLGMGMRLFFQYGYAIVSDMIVFLVWVCDCFQYGYVCFSYGFVMGCSGLADGFGLWICNGSWW